MRRTQKPKRTRPVIRKPPRLKLPLREVILCVGLTLAIIGGLMAGMQFLLYSGGRPEQILHGHDGTEYIPAQPPGDPARKAAAAVGLIITIIGLLLLASAVAAGYIAKYRRAAIERQSAHSARKE
jgi:hypothetical protein